MKYNIEKYYRDLKKQCILRDLRYISLMTLLGVGYWLLWEIGMSLKELPSIFN